MTNRERFCKQMMYLCFAAGAVVLLQGFAAQQQASAQSQPAQSQQLAYRGSGRIEIANQP
jgi:hypothetical protein